MFLFLTLLGLVSAGEIISVQTEYGQINGFRMNTQSGGQADVFLGIPFAQPPIGELRFEKPVSVTPWDTPLNATYWRKECVPHTFRAIINDADEDCLTLNIIRPTKKPAPAGGYPVLLWIHGGGFQFGSARRHGHEGFAEAYASRDVIVVSFQYRLGILGYLATGTEELPGNLGMWDMALALEFTKQVIGDFGGSPKQMTLWGVSAGAAAVGQLLVSPHTQHYAVAGIELSGSAWCSWARGNHVVDSSMQLIKELGCSSNTKQCLKQKTLKEIDEAVEKVGYATNNLLFAKWGPRIDGDFFPADPKDLAKDAPPKPIIVGMSNKDVSFFTLMKKSTVIHNLVVDDISTFGEDDLTEKITQLFIDSTEYGSQENKALTKVLEFYRNTTGQKKTSAYYVDQYNQFVGDTTFNVPMIEGVEDRQAAGWPVYLYSFDHFNSAIWESVKAPKSLWGSVHINEFTYMYGHKGIAQFEDTDADVTVKENLQEAIVSFAKTGKASWNRKPWPLAGRNMDYLSIKEDAEIKSLFFKDATDFWRKQRKLGYDLIAMEKISVHDEL